MSVINQERFSILNSSGEQLVGQVERPDVADSAFPTIVLVHGFASTMNENTSMYPQISARLALLGYQVFRFSMAGCGESQGDYAQTTISKQVADLGVVMDFVAKQSTTDVTRLGLVGMSLGTADITVYQPHNVRAIVYLGAVLDPYHALIRGFGAGFNPDGISVRNKSDGRQISLQPNFWTDIQQYDLPSLIKNIQAPIRFIHGEKDTKASVEDTRRYFENANEPKDFHVIANADHPFYEPHEREEMIDLLTEWFEKYVK